MPRGVRKTQNVPTKKQPTPAQIAAREKLAAGNISRAAAKKGPQSPTFEPMEQQIGNEKPRKMSSTGDASDALERHSNIITVENPLDPEKMAMLAFMEELVTIYIHPTSDPDAAQVFEVWNGGQKVVFVRGKEATVKRKFVDILATRKTTTFTQKKLQDSDGIWHESQVPHISLAYPYSTRRDDNPRGRDWERHVLAQQ